MAKSVQLVNVKVMRIQPRSKVSHPQVLYASYYDLLSIDLMVPTIFFFRLHDGGSDYSRMVKKVKQSLADILVPYYPMAGRWKKVENGRIRELHCNDEGVPFVEASIDDVMDNVVDFEDFKDLPDLSGFIAVPGLNHTLYNQNVDVPLPSLIVQVTRFKCGGVAMCVTGSHMTMDGYGFGTFLNSWAEVASTGTTSTKPSHDRSPALSHLDLLPSSQREVIDNAGDKLGTAFKVKKNVTFSSKLFNIKNERVDELKREAQTAVGSKLHLTTFDCITAQLWQCVARLPAAPSSESSSSQVTIWYAAEGREKFCHPPLPKHYSGNVILGVRLGQEPPSSTLQAALAVHENVKSISPAKLPRLLQDLSDMFRVRGDRKVILSSWLRLPMYELDFGFGKPFFITPNALGGGPSVGLIFVLPPPPAAGNVAALYITLEPSAMEAVLGDSQFLHLVS
ncbi:hypothetical protein Mapa_014068 [Marchantia paleacea]|nr:hypothetical protein Mapa_014068 [Marchantia paleacea]